MTLVWILVPVVLLGLLLLRLFAGYGEPGREYKVLKPWSHAFIVAGGETLFPAGGDLEPSAADVDVPGYLDEWFAGLPGQQRVLMTLLMLLMEQAPLLFGLHLRRFSGLPVEARTRYFNAWEQSSIYYRRGLLTSVRLIFSFAYLDHPKVQAALGMADRKACQPTPTTHLTAEDRGDGMLLGLEDHGELVREECDVVVIGTGAGGAVAARSLAEAGLNVIILEEGPFIRPEDVSRNCGTGMSQILYESGLRTMIGPTATPTMQGRCVGGSTLPNSAILFRFPDLVLDEWRDQFGVEGLTNDVLLPSYERVEAATDKHPARPEQLGPKNTLFAKGAQALGITAEPFSLAKTGCKGCGECMPSCPIGAKNSTDISHVPAAVRAGARLYHSCRCDEILAADRGVTGVIGTFVDSKNKKRGRMRIRCRGAVLAGGVFGSPIVLKKSGLAISSGQVGRNLHAHPGGAMFGVFPEEVNPWIGSTQGYGAFLDDRTKIEVLWAPMATMAVRLPGSGHALKEHLARFKHIAIWDTVVRGTSTGRILTYSGNNPTVWFNFNQHDTDLLIKGLRTLGEMFFAAGAQAILPGIHGLPAEIRDVEQLKLLEPGTISPKQIIVAATHLFGTCRMGENPNNSVVDSRGEAHDVHNLWICDSSVMPNGTKVNPHEPIMALSDYFSQGIIERLKQEA